MKISVVIPAYNEEKRIYNTISGFSEYFSDQGLDYELVIVNDGSTDSTEKVVKSAKCPNVIYIKTYENRGKGHAVRMGIKRASGDIKMYTDADMPFEIEAVGYSINILESGADVICGRRYFSPDYPIGRRFLSSSLGFTVKLMRLASSDTQCGFKAFKGAVADKIFEKVTKNRFSFDIEVMVIAEKMGFNIYNIPLFTSYKKGSTVKPIKDSLNIASELMHIYKNKAEGMYGDSL